MVIMSNSADTDSPISQLPLPAPCLHHPSQAPDPELGLTPDRSPTHHQKYVHFKSPVITPKARRRVDVMGKENKPTAVATDLAEVQLPLEPVMVEKPVTKAKSRRQKLRKRSSHISVVKRETVTHISNVNTPPIVNNLDTPELNTTLHLGSDILQLQADSIDIVEAVKHRLSVNERDRTSIKQKTYRKLNEKAGESSVYSDTQPVDVHESLLVDQTEKQLSKSVKPPTTRPKPSMDKPSLKQFFNSDRVYHSVVSHDQHGYLPVCLQIRRPVINQCPFDLHRRLRLNSSSVESFSK